MAAQYPACARRLSVIHQTDRNVLLRVDTSAASLVLSWVGKGLSDSRRNRRIRDHANDFLPAVEGEEYGSSLLAGDPTYCAIMAVVDGPCYRRNDFGASILGRQATTGGSLVIISVCYHQCLPTAPSSLFSTTS
jgi:hypothetical protein